MITVANTGDALLSPDGTVAAATVIEFRLVSALDKQPTEGWDTATGETVTTRFVTATTDEYGEFTVNLWPTSTLSPACLYQVRSRDGLFRTFLASLPATPATTTFQTFKASQLPLTEAELSALALHTASPVHLPPGGTTGEVLAKHSDVYYDTEWVTRAGDTGTGIIISATEPANPTEGMVWIQVPT